MKNYYSTINDTVLTFSDINFDSNNFEYMEAYFEKNTENGFIFSKWQLPSMKCLNSFGFSEDDLLYQERYLRNNILLLWEIAQENEGPKNAKDIA